jgi:uncharacterized membrane protein YedE/YeeE
MLRYVVAGAFFGIVLTKSEAISWFRMQEMFRFHSFHMYGLLFSAAAAGALGLRLIRRRLPQKQLGTGKRYVLGGIVFGLGWGLCGICPGPIFTLMGRGVTVAVVVLLSALAGTWAYAALRPKLPH